MEIDDIFKRLMKKTGLSSRGLARALGFPQNAISYYLNGKRKPTISNCYCIINFAKKYEIEITLEDIYPE